MAEPDDDKLFGFNHDDYVNNYLPRYKAEMRRREEEARAWKADKARRQELLERLLCPLLFLLTPHGLVWLVLMAAGFLVPYENYGRWIFWASITLVTGLMCLINVFKSGGL